MKRLLLSIAAIITGVGLIILVSCDFNTDENILKRLEKHLDKHLGYKTELTMRIIIDDEESIYKMRETYSLGGKYKLEILEPSESKDISIEYDGKKIYIKHASIKESIELNPIKNFDQSLLIGKFLREREKIKSIKEEEINGEKYYVFTNGVEDSNKYSNQQKVWLKKDKFKPYKLKILDRNGRERVIIEYSNFEYIK